MKEIKEIENGTNFTVNAKFGSVSIVLL